MLNNCIEAVKKIIYINTGVKDGLWDELSNSLATLVLHTKKIYFEKNSLSVTEWIKRHFGQSLHQIYCLSTITCIKAKSLSPVSVVLSR